MLQVLQGSTALRSGPEGGPIFRPLKLKVLKVLSPLFGPRSGTCRDIRRVVRGALSWPLGPWLLRRFLPPPRGGLLLLLRRLLLLLLSSSFFFFLVWGLWALRTGRGLPGWRSRRRLGERSTMVAQGRRRGGARGALGAAVAVAGLAGAWSRAPGGPRLAPPLEVALALPPWSIRPAPPPPGAPTRPTGPPGGGGGKDGRGAWSPGALPRPRPPPPGGGPGRTPPTPRGVPPSSASLWSLTNPPWHGWRPGRGRRAGARGLTGARGRVHDRRAGAAGGDVDAPHGHEPDHGERGDLLVHHHHGHRLVHLHHQHRPDLLQVPPPRQHVSAGPGALDRPRRPAPPPPAPPRPAALDVRAASPSGGMPRRLKGMLVKGRLVRAWPGGTGGGGGGGGRRGDRRALPESGPRASPAVASGRKHGRAIFFPP